MTDRPLWKHQQECVDRAKELDHYGLFLEMGTGKTRTTIEIIKQKMIEQKRTLKTLIVAPTVVTFNWKKELSQYSEIDPAHILVLHGTQVDRKRALERTPNYFVVIINYETLLMDMVFTHLKAWAPDIVVADESHRIKNPKSQRTKRLTVLGDIARYRYILSGTPITQNEADLYSQFRFMDGGETFGKSYFTFRNLWFTDANAEKRKFTNVTWPDWRPKPHKAEDFKSKVMSKAMSVTKAECLDLPPYIQTTIEVGMSPEQQKAYRQMKDEFIVFIKSQAFTAELAVTKALRLLQVTCGFLTNTEGQVHVFTNTPKDKALLDLIDSASNKVVVWCPWRAAQSSLRQLLTRNKINHREIIGDSGAKERDDALREFADDDKVKVMLASQGAAGVGISLVSANTAVYYGRNFSFEHDSQSAARIHRGGSEIHSHIYRMDLVVPDTIDQSCMEAVAKKEELKDAIINSHLKV